MRTEALNFIVDYTIEVDANFLAENEAELYISEYAVFEYYVTNSGVVYNEVRYINDLEESDYSDTANIFLVSEISDSRDELHKLFEERTDVQFI